MRRWDPVGLLMYEQSFFKENFFEKKNLAQNTFKHRLSDMYILHEINPFPTIMPIDSPHSS